MTNLFASYAELADAERAAGALLDQGARSEDISIVANERYAGAYADAAKAKSQAKGGFSTTTPADAAMGASKGLTIGVGVGILAALAALAVPGVGLVIGGGALATAIAGGLGTAAAGAVAGGVAGYLKDQGMGDDVITHYSKTFDDGGAILGLSIPTGTLADGMAESLLVKYGALNVESVSATRTSLRSGGVPPVIPPQGQVAADLDGSINPSMPISAVRATRTDPITGEPIEGVVTDPVTGFDRAVRIEDHRVIYMS